MTPSLPPALEGAISSARNLLVLTGAGMSAESGVPVFRGQGGLWEGSRPEDLATPQAFARDPERVWRWYRWRLEAVESARPHSGYEALARLETGRGLARFTLVTQNVDGLHQRAGSRNVLELHGNITRARCDAGCGALVPSARVDPSRPACHCGKGRLRPDVVWFGEPLSPRVLEAAFEAVAEADMAWVVGTSSLVYPAAALPEHALRHGIPVVEVNPEATPLSDHASFVIRAGASEGLAALETVRAAGGKGNEGTAGL
jgi:NAD-dependent deacetylase